MAVPALSDTQLYDQKERYSHDQFYRLSCRSSLCKLLHFFWSPLGVGFLLSCQCLLKFSGTLQSSSLVSAVLFCPLYSFCTLYSFCNTERQVMNSGSPTVTRSATGVHVPLQRNTSPAFLELMHETFSHRMHLLQISYWLCGFLMQVWSHETTDTIHLSVFWERGAWTEDKDGCCVNAQLTQ